MSEVHSIPDEYTAIRLDAELRMNEGCSLRITAMPDDYPTHVQAVCRMVSELYTEPEWRGQGCAERLLKKVCEEADQAGMALVLESKPEDGQTDSVRLQSFYVRLGFVVFQKRPLLLCRKHLHG